jgi:uncharacterized membrane protein
MLLFQLLLVVIFIVVIFLVVALFLKKDYSLQREIVVNKPKAEVFEYIKSLKNQEYFNKWIMIDPNVKRSYTGVDGEVGNTVSWESENKNVGKGTQEITKIIPGEQVDFVIHFEKPFKNTADCFIKVEQVEANKTKVIWGFSGRMAYPMNAMLLVMSMDNLLGPDLATSLENIKSVLEK